MTITAIRKKLIDYLADADADKVKAIYTLLENEIEEQYELTEEQFEILDRERELHLNGLSKSYSRQEARLLVTGK
ncbi:MAG: hypothetical protein EOP47_26180 [Sphingobacteriaceae bacterium]|nr:MAG: hypothetical protein EOP47_26180 [Sphingobacteriaceae bacterium]